MHDNSGWDVAVRHCRPHSHTQEAGTQEKASSASPHLRKHLLGHCFLSSLPSALACACRAADSHHTGSSPESSRLRFDSEKQHKGRLRICANREVWAGSPSVLESYLSIGVAAAAVAITVTVTAHHIAVTGASLTASVACNHKTVVDMSSVCKVYFKRHLLLSTAASLGQ